MSQWLSSAPPHHTLPAFLNLDGRTKSLTEQNRAWVLGVNNFFSWTVQNKITLLNFLILILKNYFCGDFVALKSYFEDYLVFSEFLVGYGKKYLRTLYLANEYRNVHFKGLRKLWIKIIKSKINYRNLPLRSKKQEDFRNSLFLLWVTTLWHMAQRISRAPPHHTLPVFLNRNGMFENFNILTLIGIEGVEERP